MRPKGFAVLDMLSNASAVKSIAARPLGLCNGVPLQASNWTPDVNAMMLSFKMAYQAMTHNIGASGGGNNSNSHGGNIDLMYPAQIQDFIDSMVSWNGRERAERVLQLERDAVTFLQNVNYMEKVLVEAETNNMNSNNSSGSGSMGVSQRGQVNAKDKITSLKQVLQDKLLQLKIIAAVRSADEAGKTNTSVESIANALEVTASLIVSLLEGLQITSNVRSLYQAIKNCQHCHLYFQKK